MGTHSLHCGGSLTGPTCVDLTMTVSRRQSCFLSDCYILGVVCSTLSICTGQQLLRFGSGLLLKGQGVENLVPALGATVMQDTLRSKAL